MPRIQKTPVNTNLQSTRVRKVIEFKAPLLTNQSKECNDFT